MLDPVALRENIEREKPDHIIPEVEAIATQVLVELEKKDTMLPRPPMRQFLTMNREGIRRLSAEELGVTHFSLSLLLPTSEEFKDAG